MTTPAGRDGERLRARLADALRHERRLNCGEIAYWLNQYKMLATDAVARCEALETALRELMDAWQQRIALSERDVAAGEYSQAGCDSERGKRCVLRECIGEVRALLSGEPPAPEGGTVTNAERAANRANENLDRAIALLDEASRLAGEVEDRYAEGRIDAIRDALKRKTRGARRLAT